MWLVEMTTVSSKVCDYIREYQNLGFEVTPDHYLSADLLIHGSYGLHFVIDFGKEFDTDFSEMTITRHFACKTLFADITRFFRSVIKSENPVKNELVDLQVSDMIKAVEKSKWSDDILNERIHS